MQHVLATLETVWQFVFNKAKHSLGIWYSNGTPHKHLQTNLYSSFINHGPNLEAIELLFSRWMNIKLMPFDISLGVRNTSCNHGGRTWTWDVLLYFAWRKEHSSDPWRKNLRSKGSDSAGWSSNHPLRSAGRTLEGGGSKLGFLSLVTFLWGHPRMTTFPDEDPVSYLVVLSTALSLIW